MRNKRITLKKITAHLVLVCFLMVSTQCFGLTIKEEKELGDEFMKMVQARFQFNNDPGVKAYVNEIGQKIIKNAGLQPFEYTFYVIKDDQFNAFAGPGAHICINSGLFASMESESELAGILGHEIAHVTCRHISDKIKRSSKTSLITLAGVMAGVFLGIAGLGTASEAIMLGTISGVQSADLAYSREDEMQADVLGLQYLEKAGYDAKGLLKTLKRIKEADFMGSEYPVYLSTHPAIDARIIFISERIKDAKDPALFTPKTTLDFEHAKTRLLVQNGKTDQVVNEFKAAISKDPENHMANYGYGLALLRAGKYDLSLFHLQKAQAGAPHDPFLKIDIGKAHCLNGNYAKAVEYLEEAQSLYKDSEGMLQLGKCQMELGNFSKAEAILKEISNPDPEKIKKEMLEDLEKPPEDEEDPMETRLMRLPMEDPMALRAIYYLAEVYHRWDKPADSHFYLGSYYQKTRKLDSAKFHLTKALEYSTNEEQRKQIMAMLKHMDRYERKYRSRSLN